MQETYTSIVPRAVQRRLLLNLFGYRWDGTGYQLGDQYISEEWLDAMGEEAWQTFIIQRKHTHPEKRCLRARDVCSMAAALGGDDVCNRYRSGGNHGDMDTRAVGAAHRLEHRLRPSGSEKETERAAPTLCESDD